MSRPPLLIVVSGRPGTGKTTLSRALAAEIGAAYVRIDAIETAIVRAGVASRPVGPVGYVVAHEVASANVQLGTSVVVDAVNPVAEARAGWQNLASIARCVFFETTLADADEHRRRVEQRQPDLADQVVPTWQDVLDQQYEPWDETRDGLRYEIDTSDLETALVDALAHLRHADDRHRGDASPHVGIVDPRGFSHVRLTVTDIARSKAFYQRLFGMAPGSDFSAQVDDPTIHHDPQRTYGGCSFTFHGRRSAYVRSLRRATDSIPTASDSITSASASTR